MSDYRDELSSIIKNRGITYRQLASELKTSATYISDFFNRRKNLSCKAFFNLLNFLNLKHIQADRIRNEWILSLTQIKFNIPNHKNTLPEQYDVFSRKLKYVGYWLHQAHNESQKQETDI